MNEKYRVEVVEFSGDIKEYECAEFEATPLGYTLFFDDGTRIILHPFNSRRIVIHENKPMYSNGS